MPCRRACLSISSPDPDDPRRRQPGERVAARVGGGEAVAVADGKKGGKKPAEHTEHKGAEHKGGKGGKGGKK